MAFGEALRAYRLPASASSMPRAAARGFGWTGGARGRRQADLAAQAARFMQDRYLEPITVQTLADLLGCSAGYLSRMFKKRPGTSPIDYWTRFRLDKAMQLLRETEATVREIAIGVGYLDAYYFSRLFKKAYRSVAASLQERFKDKNRALGLTAEEEEA